MYVYVISAGPNAHKIGISTTPEKRLITLQGANMANLELVYCERVSDPYVVETHAHRILKLSRGNGEWFNVTEDVAIDAIMMARLQVEGSDHLWEESASPPKISAPRMPRITDPDSAAKWCIFVRYSEGLTQSQLARMVDTTPSVINQLERGRIIYRRVAHAVLSMRPEIANLI